MLHNAAHTRLHTSLEIAMPPVDTNAKGSLIIMSMRLTLMQFDEVECRCIVIGVII
jgi:hypothetical protein